MPNYYVNVEGAEASNYSSADYSGNFFTYTLDGLHDAYFIGRFARALDHSSASLTGNRVWVEGTASADQVSINVQVSATDGSTAYSYGNDWLVDFGDGDDSGEIFTSATGIGAGAVASVSQDRTTMEGGGGADVLAARHVLTSLDGAWVSIDGTVCFVNGGEGDDSIGAQLFLDSGNANLAGGTANYSFNRLHVNAGADGADIQASAFINSYGGGAVDVIGNNLSFNGGDLNAGTSIQAGNASLAGGSVNYSGNSISAMTAAEGGTVFAQNSLWAAQGGVINFSDNLTILADGVGTDFIGTGIGLTVGSGGSASISNNSIFVGGGAGDDHFTHFISSRADAGGSVTISGNYYYTEGGDGDDTLELFWSHFDNGGSVDFSSNNAELLGGTGSDTITAYLGEAVRHSSILLSGGDGDDFIQSSDVGQNNQVVITGGAGNDTIVDEIGFTTVIFEGNFADYTLKALNGGWVSVTDNREGSPDGTDQLYQVDMLQFGDQQVLLADLNLPIEGTDGDEALIGSEGDDVIYGYGGNDDLRGAGGNDKLDGGSGDDILYGMDGDDFLLGGAGNDQLFGNRGADQLTGGSGADRFVFGVTALSADQPDLITDFSGAVVFGTNQQGNVVRTPGERDKIDLSLLDANTNVDGDQAFTLVQHGFSGTAGEAYSSYNADSGITSLFLDVDGDAVADVEIQLLGQANLTGADFIF